MALVLFANNILFGQDYRRQVTYWLLSLVEDIEAFSLFPWGHYVFKMTLHYIRISFKVPEPMGPARRYNLYGFIWGVQLTGLPEISPTRMELKEDYWLGIDDDLSEGPQFVPLKDLGNKEDGNERGGRKRNRYRGPDEPIKRRRNLRDTSPPRHTIGEDSDRRTTRDGSDIPDMSPPLFSDRGIPVDDPHSPGATYTAIPNQLLDHVRIIVREEVQTAMESEFAKFRADFFKMFSNQIPSRFSTEDYAEHDDSDGEPAFQLNTGLGVYDPFRAQKKVEVAEQYTAFMNASGLLYRNIGIDACVSRSFFTVLEQPTSWLGNDHVDAYINLLCKRKQDPVQGRSFPRKESLSSIWRKFQPNFHRPLLKPFYPKDFEVPTDLIIYAIGEKPAWETPWADVDDVLVPCNVGDNRWVLCVVRLNDWVITIFDSNAHLQPNYPRYREHQVLPLRRLFPLICKASGYYDVSKRRLQNMNCIKAVRLAPHLFPYQTDGDSCGVFMLKGLEYVMMNKDPNFDFNQDNIPAFRKQMARDIFANSLPFH
ncbi:hypothetical protein Dsin_021473 [Dipteronia sinensis]|uniref:Ubiquitin-like protease family profile domain-containing protein n=1 Tax=Dipteronia sinensis TaxID=43782 RepID=A0AAD9ZZL5_9ROSI|nr:hypothetical protein Dsin_021473 [Dipteronia sinensis]